MSIDRRDFLKNTGQAAAIGCLLPWSQSAIGLLAAPPRKKLRVLILGGTSFLGPPVVEVLQKRGHHITLFNRGQTRPKLFPDLEKLRGDRYSDVTAIEGRQWDVVIDNCGYHPKQIRLSAAALKNCGFYLFVSTVSVYADGNKKDRNENSAVGTIENPEKQRATNASYGPLKALCEQETTKAFPKNSVIVRPGLIVGPGDWSDRFTYWPMRVAKGGEILAPGKPEWGVQYIDVRDLATWMVHLCEKKTLGTYNALGPKTPTPFGDLLESCKRVSKSDGQFVWMSQEFMKAEKIDHWVDMPAYINPPEGMDRPTTVSNALAVAAGLKFRHIDETVKGALDYHLSRDKDHKFRNGLSAEREQEILKTWHQQNTKVKNGK